MSGPNSNLSRPPIYSPNQNVYSLMANAGKLPPDVSHPISGSPYLPPISSLVPPASMQQTFSPSGMVPVPPNAQNYGFPSPQVPSNADSSLKPPPTGFSNHSPQQPASPKNPALSYEKPSFVQNGPISNSPFSSRSNSGQSLNGGNSLQVNGHGVSSNALGPSHSMPPPPQPSQWSSPSRLPPPSDPNQKSSTSSMGGASPMPHQYTGASLQSAVTDGKPVPKMSQVPSAGLPMPYGSQNISSPSPLATPGTSQPPSARSSRNPSPISTQRYDYMEGQFSIKPSPSNSSLGLQNMGVSPVSNSGLFPPDPRSSGDSNQSLTPQMQNLYPPGSHTPYTPNSSVPGSQPGPGMTPLPVTPQAGPRPRYPQQLGYNQTPPQYPSPVVNQPNSMPAPPNSMYNASPQPPYQQQQQQQQQPLTPQQQSPYPQQYQGTLPDGPVGGMSGYDPQLHAKMAGMSVHSSFSRLWGNDNINLLQDRNILPPVPIDPPKPVLTPDRPNCSPSIFRSTLTKIPDTSSLLQKSRLPFGVLIHPFRDADSLSVITCNTIVRCRNCRTYINPFVSFIDQRRWKCNLCFRVNDLPEEFLYDPATRSYGDPSRRPEIRNATIEFIAPSDYMLRPPQPAVYLFLLDVSHAAVENGYLSTFCKILLESLDELPGDTRTLR